MSDERIVSTPHGPARLVHYRARRPRLTLALGHGAGGGIEAPELALLGRRLPPQSINVVLVEQPWRRAGKRVAAAPKALDEGWIAAVNALRIRTPLVVGGRSAGARVACRTGRWLGAVGVIAMAFPLHPSGRPEPSRLSELRGARLPTLVVQGERDSFGSPSQFPDEVGVAALERSMVVVPEADHSFRVRKSAELSQDETLELIVEGILEWATRVVL